MHQNQGRDPAVPTGVSMTALWVAQARAQESTRSEPLFDDSLAEAFVDAAGSTTPLTIDHLLEEIQSDMSELDAIHKRFLDYVALRTKFFDDYLLQACTVDCRQVVILAAGLDTRAFRLSWPQGIRLFELDFPEVFTFNTTAALIHRRSLPVFGSGSVWLASGGVFASATSSTGSLALRLAE